MKSCLEFFIDTHCPRMVKVITRASLLKQIARIGFRTLRTASPIGCAHVVLQLNPSGTTARFLHVRIEVRTPLLVVREHIASLAFSAPGVAVGGLRRFAALRALAFRQ